MVLLKGGTHYLLLSRNENGRHEIACHEGFERAVADWTTTGTRISPIFSLNDAPAPKFSDGSRTWLRFCGPIHPNKAEVVEGAECYLSLGLYNLLFLCRGDAARHQLQDFVDRHGVQWEEWEIDGQAIKGVRYSALTPSKPLLTKEILSPLFAGERVLAAAGREYVTLMAASLSRGARCTPASAAELAEFDAVFRRKLLPMGNKSTAVKQGLLVTTNAALSRYTSQTYAGTSPIIESECHYYTHSLLGIGTASLALTQIRRFVERAVVFTAARSNSTITQCACGTKNAPNARSK